MIPNLGRNRGGGERSCSCWPARILVVHGPREWYAQEHYFLDFVLIAPHWTDRGGVLKYGSLVCVNSNILCCSFAQPIHQANRHAQTIYLNLFIHDLLLV